MHMQSASSVKLLESMKTIEDKWYFLQVCSPPLALGMPEQEEMVNKSTCEVFQPCSQCLPIKAT